MKLVNWSHLPKATQRKITLAALILLAVFCWAMAILLLLEVTRQLLDTLRYIVELAQMS